MNQHSASRASRRIELNCFVCGKRFVLGTNGCEDTDGKDKCDRCAEAKRDKEGRVVSRHGQIEKIGR